MQRAAIYIRVSTREQAEEGYSLAGQEKLLRQYCDAHKWDVVQIYADEGISAKDIQRRPQMLQMLQDAAAGQFDKVVIWKLTRFTRSLADLCKAYELLSDNKVALVSYSEAFDCSTSAGRMLMNILGTIAQWEREVISENVIMAANERAARGLRTCHTVLGYDVIPGGDMTINEAEAMIVRHIYDEYLIYKNVSIVADSCAACGYRGKKGGRPTPWSVERILTNFVYTGYYSWHRQPIKGNFEPIISPDQYNEVQRIISRSVCGRTRKEAIVYIDKI